MFPWVTRLSLTVYQITAITYNFSQKKRCFLVTISKPLTLYLSLLIWIVFLQEEIKTLMTYLIEKYFNTFEGINYVQTFKGLKQRYDQQQERAVLMNRLDTLFTVFLLYLFYNEWQKNNWYMKRLDKCYVVFFINAASYICYSLESIWNQLRWIKNITRKSKSRQVCIMF